MLSPKRAGSPSAPAAVCSSAASTCVVTRPRRESDRSMTSSCTSAKRCTSSRAAHTVTVSSRPTPRAGPPALTHPQWHMTGRSRLPVAGQQPAAQVLGQVGPQQVGGLGAARAPLALELGADAVEDEIGASQRLVEAPAPRPAPRWPSSRRGPRRRWRWGGPVRTHVAPRCSAMRHGPDVAGCAGAASGARGRWALTLGHISPSDQGIVQRCRPGAAASGGCSACRQQRRRLVGPRARRAEPGQQGDLLAAPHRHLAPPRDRCHDVVPRLPRPRRRPRRRVGAPAGRGRRALPGPGTARARRHPPSRRGSGSAAGRGGARPPRDRARRRRARRTAYGSGSPGAGWPQNELVHTPGKVRLSRARRVTSSVVVGVEDIAGEAEVQGRLRPVDGRLGGGAERPAVVVDEHDLLVLDARHAPSSIDTLTGRPGGDLP